MHERLTQTMVSTVIWMQKLDNGGYVTAPVTTTIQTDNTPIHSKNFTILRNIIQQRHAHVNQLDNGDTREGTRRRREKYEPIP